MSVSFEMLSEHEGNPRAKLLGETLDRATGTVLEQQKSPSRRGGELDNRGSHFYMSLYWAQELAKQTEDAEISRRFGPLAERLARDRAGDRRRAERRPGCAPVDIGGYYHPDLKLVEQAMRPSATFNAALASL